MRLDYITEAFKALSELNEDIFSITPDSLADLNNQLEMTSSEEAVQVIDPEAETEDDLQDNYIGKIIVDCSVCHSHIFQNKEDIDISVDGEVNVEQTCPYCGEAGGFTIIGEIKEFTPDSEDEVDTTSPDVLDDPGNEPALDAEVESEEAEVIEESLTEGTKKYKPHTLKLLKMIGANIDESLDESFNNVSIETDDQKMTMTSEDNGKVVVTTEPIEALESEESVDETIAPISAETQNELIDSVADDATDIADDPLADDTAEVEDELDFDIEEVDETAMDELGESYLKRVYENVDSFKTSNISSTGNKLIIEGVITFKSGSQKNTGFIFEAKDATKDGKVRFIGENAQFSRGKKSFTLAGSLDNKKLFVESFTYNYRAKNPAGKSTRVYGTVTRNI